MNGEVYLKYNWIWILIAIYVVLRFTKKLWMPLIKGSLGEATVSGILGFLDKDKYKVIHNVMIPSGLSTTQVDHVIVSCYGIFVIEGKNYKGWILGSENGDKWTQSIYGHKNQFMNPIHQNYGHVKAIEVLLEENGLSDIPIIPIVTFPGDATIKIDFKKSIVVKWGALNNAIKERSVNAAVSKDQMNTLVALFENANVDSKKNRESHVKNIHEKTKAEKRSIEEGICPKCGGNLVKKNGKYGDFYGCSNYPKCRYTKKIYFSKHLS